MSKSITTYAVRWSLTCILMCALYTGNAQNSCSALVNPFIGTGGHGHTFPGATVPFGMVQCSPDTRIDGSWDGCGGYHYSDSIIYGITETHLSGTGCTDYGDILLMPTLTASTDKKNYTSSFSHKNEDAKAGYYRVHLNKPNTDVELTTTTRCAIHRYTFHNTGKAYFVLDLTHRDELLEGSIHVNADKTITGLRRSKAWAENQAVYYAITFSLPYTVTIEKGKVGDTKALLTFDVKDGQQVYAKVAISAVDEAGALNNMKTELPGWNFDKTRRSADSLWNKELSKIEVKGGSKDDQVIFYTAMYHTMVQPNTFNDADGRYRGRDNKIHHADFNYYTVFSIWDTYRAAHPLYTIIEPDRDVDFIKTFVTEYEQGGLLPMWELWSNETNCMIAYHAVSIIADAAAKGFTGFDWEKAYVAMKASAAQTREGIKTFHDKGYLTIEDQSSSVSKTLEYAYDDWCIAQMAKMLHHDADYTYYMKYATAWTNVFDPKTGFMRPRFNGGWLNPFDPFEVNGHYTEANSFQYSFYAPQSMSTFIKLSGGNEAFTKNLLGAFTAESKTTGNDQADIAGMIGQYAHGNEPSHHMAYLFNYTGDNTYTLKYTQQVLHTLYHNDPDGLSGNEDCGQMSAWYVLSAMGIYEPCPGNPEYALAEPIFDDITIHTPTGKLLHITKGTGDASFNGVKLKKSFISYKELMDGGTLILSSKPIISEAGAMETPSLSIPVPTAPIINAMHQVFADTLNLSISKQYDGLTIHYTIDGTMPTAKSMAYTQPFSINNNTTVKAITIDDKGNTGWLSQGKFNKRNNNWSVQLISTPESQYAAGGADALVDGMRGSLDWRRGRWQGYLTDFTCVLDLQKVQTVKEVGAGFLQETGAWIVYPSEVDFYTSTDGVTYSKANVYKTPVPITSLEVQMRDFEMAIAPVQARYIKIVARNYGKLPAWHESAGEQAHLFVDEVWAK